MHINLSILIDLEKDLYELKNSSGYQAVVKTFMTGKNTNTVELLLLLYSTQNVFDKNKEKFIELGLYEVTLEIEESLLKIHKHIGCTIPRLISIDHDLNEAVFRLFQHIESKVHSISKCIKRFPNAKQNLRSYL